MQNDFLSSSRLHLLLCFIVWIAITNYGYTQSPRIDSLQSDVFLSKSCLVEISESYQITFSSDEREINIPLPKYADNVTEFEADYFVENTTDPALANSTSIGAISITFYPYKIGNPYEYSFLRVTESTTNFDDESTIIVKLRYQADDVLQVVNNKTLSLLSSNPKLQHPQYLFNVVRWSSKYNIAAAVSLYQARIHFSQDFSFFSNGMTLQKLVEDKNVAISQTAATVEFINDYTVQFTRMRLKLPSTYTVDEHALLQLRQSVVPDAILDVTVSYPAQIETCVETNILLMYVQLILIATISCFAVFCVTSAFLTFFFRYLRSLGQEMMIEVMTIFDFVYNITMNVMILVQVIIVLMHLNGDKWTLLMNGILQMNGLTIPLRE